ncbi:unnamed protein product [Vicia faba]|uniref:Uncharacterized protein n=1 Tax=Vicia faba TaxID=3906 RepID=A0AAV1AB12_VICFA|nr:unnamed protein product [Vicia faba]CAI8606268.1 unnamed protein product [Vicia faba]
MGVEENPPTLHLRTAAVSYRNKTSLSFNFDSDGSLSTETTPLSSLLSLPSTTSATLESPAAAADAIKIAFFLGLTTMGVEIRSSFEQLVGKPICTLEIGLAVG